MTKEEIIKEANDLLKHDLLNIINAFHAKKNIQYFINATYVPSILLDDYLEEFNQALENRRLFIEQNNNY